jgi:hypothetical protein
MVLSVSLFRHFYERKEVSQDFCADELGKVQLEKWKTLRVFKERGSNAGNWSHWKLKSLRSQQRTVRQTGELM